VRYYNIDDVDLAGKRVLVRIDVNSPVKNKKIIGLERIQEHSVTIKHLIKKRAKSVLISYQGRKGEKDFISLKQHARYLSKFCKKTIIFVEDITGKKAIEKIKSLKNGDVLLLENSRFLEEENDSKAKKKVLVKTLAPLFDYFIFDAFSVAHRDIPSVTGFGKRLPVIAGRAMEKELKGLEKIKNVKRPYVFLLGGGKIDDCVLLIEKRLRDVDYVLCGGKIGIAGLISQGYKIEAVDGYFPFLKRIKRFVNNKKLILPIDFATRINGKRREFSTNKFSKGHPALDIGSKTIDKYKKILLRAKTVYIKGPMGFYEQKGFEKGEKILLKTIARSKAFSIAGGGHTANAIDMFINRKKISYFSLSGGALLEYIAGKELPGLKILKKVKR